VQWDTFAFIVGYDSVVSYSGTISLVPPSGTLVGSTFLLGLDGWTVSGNKVANSNPTFEPLSRAGLNNYIIATDDKINVPYTGSPDSSLWYFSAPVKFFGNWGISYGGSQQFTLGAFSGDFSKLNGMGVSLLSKLHSNKKASLI